MKTQFKYQELWDIVETGFAELEPALTEPNQQLRENRKKDAKALFFIQQAIDDEIFPRIAATTTSKMAWETLRQEYLGDKKVISVKLQTFGRKFETLALEKTETVQVFLSRVFEVVNLMKSYGENITNEIVSSKVFRSLTPKFDHIVPAIEESNDLSDYSYDKLLSLLMALGDRLDRSGEKAEEKAFQVNGDSSPKGKNNMTGSRGRGRGCSRGRGRGGGRGRGHQSEHGQYKSSIQCRYCKKFDHKEADCWTKQKDEQKEANFAKSVEEEESNLFMAQSSVIGGMNGLWFIGSGCSNHMSSMKSLFRDLDESLKIEVRLGDDKQVHDEGKGTIAIKTVHYNVKLLYDVQYVPTLAHNLLSVGKLMTSGHSVVFDGNACAINDKKIWTDHSLCANDSKSYVSP